MLALIALLGTAHAACDAKLLEKTLAESGPNQVPAAFVELADCDAAKARKLATTRLKMMPANDEAVKASIKAVELGSSADVRTWLLDLAVDERSRMVARLGEACAESPAVGDFFVGSQAQLGERFWIDRWYRALAGCRTEGVQKLLTDALTASPIDRSSRNRSQFFGLVEVWAKNLGIDAVPTITAMIAAPKDEEEAALLVTSFGDAAAVGSSSGPIPEVAAAAEAALVAAAPTLPRRALDRARDVLTALGASATADSLARWAFPDAWTDRGYTYGVALVEDVACKNGQRRGVLHLSSLQEGGTHWPEQVGATLDALLATAWSPEGAAKCKGTSTLTTQISPTPVVGTAGVEAWQAEVRTAFETSMAGAQKIEVLTHPEVAAQ